MTKLYKYVITTPFQIGQTYETGAFGSYEVVGVGLAVQHEEGGEIEFRWADGLDGEQGGLDFNDLQLPKEDVTAPTFKPSEFVNIDCGQD
jgi:hypothetical protein